MSLPPKLEKEKISARFIWQHSDQWDIDKQVFLPVIKVEEELSKYVRLCDECKRPLFRGQTCNKEQTKHSECM